MNTIEQLQANIQACFQNPEEAELKKAKSSINQTIEMLDQGKIRVCSKVDEKWVINSWVKQAILLYFRSHPSEVISSGAFSFFDKVPVKQWTGKERVRVVPQALVRKGAFVAPNTVLMPSYINIGAYVGEGSLIDTWATVGSCAQVGKNVHISGGVGLGGVLEPIQAQPVIIEDNAFIGSRCILVEGAVVEEGAVLGAGVVITASSKIIDVTGEKEVIYTGRVPKNSVVIPGTRKKIYPSGEQFIPCAFIIGQRSKSTDLKTSLNDCLRDIPV